MSDKHDCDSQPTLERAYLSAQFFSKLAIQCRKRLIKKKNGRANHKAASYCDEATARSLAEAAVSAEACGLPLLGFAHLPDYLASLVAGRIAGSADPVISSPAPAMIRSNAMGGIAQLGFDLAVDELIQRATSYGVALFAQENSYTTGELGYYVRRLAKAGLVALAATNGPALMAGPGGKKAVYCTNPHAFAAPRLNSPVLIDQASSATAFASIRQAAERDIPIPLGWAIDAHGEPTTDAKEALRGALMPFGGPRGANIALMVEILAAGVSGANWSLDSPGFLSGDRSPGAGLLVIAIAPQLLDPGFAARLDRQMQRLKELGLYVPGERKARCEDLAHQNGLSIAMPLFQQRLRLISAAKVARPLN